MSDKKIVTNVLRQNCFVREVVRSDSVISQPDKYLALDEVVRPDGTGSDLNYHVEDYPITPEYVNSFADSADYHNDPLAAISNSKPRQNLCDLTTFQRVMDMDCEQARGLYAQLSKIFGKNLESGKIDEVNKSEVTANE